MSTDHGMNNHQYEINRITVVPTQKCSNTNDNNKTCNGSTNQLKECAIFNETNATADNNKPHEIHITINCTNKINEKKDSMLIRCFQNLFHWRLNSRHIGYYSPRTNHSIDTINVRLNPVVIVTNDNSQENSEQNSMHCKGIADDYMKDDSGDVDSISNSSLKDKNDGMEMKDELESYMEELRLREIR